ncbi:substrate-binding domain-containing protein [Halomonas dongshanensis]|uniref:Substrate-binding domain-containing protein n=1 Tax=Halomonas dongshanensis TaxID=2890835 RepID=A0ABT2E9M2_9GAMM|nr:substrate-binding domain-containing protein [Halomonas dongshanensis]MCS2608250.1 substrate-binding domain-containing protein [Halomonas dongshanensis]
MLNRLAIGLAATLTLGPALAVAQERPAPFDAPEEVSIAVVRYISTGDFFQAYLAGVEAQAEALGVELRVLDSRQDAALQADMVDQAIALGVDGIIIQHGLSESMQEAAQRAIDAGIDVVAFDVEIDNPAIPQIEQSNYLLGELALEQAAADNGDDFTAGYVYVPGIAPLDQRNAAWEDFKAAHPGVTEAAVFGTLDNPIANAVANQARAVIQANPAIDVFFAPYNEFAAGVKIAVDEMGLGEDISIYSADISTSDIAAMREPGSPWAATVATNPTVVGEVSVRTLALLMAGETIESPVIVPPTLITQDFLDDNAIDSMATLSEKMPQFAHAEVALADWLPLPAR